MGPGLRILLAATLCLALLSLGEAACTDGGDNCAVGSCCGGAQIFGRCAGACFEGCPGLSGCASPRAAVQLTLAVLKGIGDATLATIAGLGKDSVNTTSSSCNVTQACPVPGAACPAIWSALTEALPGFDYVIGPANGCVYIGDATPRASIALAIPGCSQAMQAWAVPANATGGRLSCLPWSGAASWNDSMWCYQPSATVKVMGNGTLSLG